MYRFRQTAVSFAVCCSLLMAHHETRADNYMLDGQHTAIVFGVSHFGYSFTYGRFNRAKGSFVWDNANPAASKFQLAIDAASIDTNDEQRDGHLRNADFFNVKQFPQITFQSTSVRPAQKNPQGTKDLYDVVGNLTIHGVTKQISLPVQKLGEGTGPYGKYRCGFICQTKINRSDFGMTNMLPKIGDQVALTITFEGLRQGAVGSTTQPASSGPAAQPADPGSAPKGSSGAR